MLTHICDQAHQTVQLKMAIKSHFVAKAFNEFSLEIAATTSRKART